MHAPMNSVASNALAWAENGFRHMTNSKRDVKTPEDLKGLKMRTMENPVHIAAYKGFGIITTPMAFPEVFTALETKVAGLDFDLKWRIPTADWGRFTLSGDIASPASEAVLMDLDSLSSATNHNGGALHFGSDLAGHQGRTLYFADETGGAPAAATFAPGPATLLTGPEGGFTPEEAAAIRAAPGASAISLGPRILRAETAALAGVAAWMAAVGDWR